MFIMGTVLFLRHTFLTPFYKTDRYLTAYKMRYSC